MARIAGVDIPREKRAVIALTYIYGVGPTRARQTLAETGIGEDVRVRDLTEDQVQRLRNHIENAYRVEGDLRREVANNTNARTRKGPKKAVGGIRKPTRKH